MFKLFDGKTKIRQKKNRKRLETKKSKQAKDNIKLYDKDVVITTKTDAHLIYHRPKCTCDDCLRQRKTYRLLKDGRELRRKETSWYRKEDKYKKRLRRLALDRKQKDEIQTDTQKPEKSDTEQSSSEETVIVCKELVEEVQQN